MRPEERERGFSTRPHFVFRGTTPLLPIYYSPTSFSYWCYVSRFASTDLWIREPSRARVCCYEFVVVGGRVRNYQASKPVSLLSTPSFYLPSLVEISFTRPSVFSNSILREEEKGGKSKRGGDRVSPFSYSPTPHNISPLNSWWEKLERGKKKKSKHAALLSFDPCKVDRRTLAKTPRMNENWSFVYPCRPASIFLPIFDLRDISRPCLSVDEMIRSRVHEIYVMPGHACSFHYPRRQRIRNEITSGYAKLDVVKFLPRC